MDRGNRLRSPSMSPDRGGVNNPTFAIKQEVDDSNNSLNWTTGNRSKILSSDVNHDVQDAKLSMKKEPDSPRNERNTFQGTGQMNERPGFGAEVSKQPSLVNDFRDIRSCLQVVLSVDGGKRHALVQAISSKLKYIEALTTGKGFSKRMFHLERSNRITGCLSKLCISRSQQPDETGDESSPPEIDDLKIECMKNGTESPKQDCEGLVKEVGDGLVKCKVCDKFVRKYCTACSSFVSRTRLRCRNLGLPLPSCNHKNFSGGSHCKSCRLRKYVQLNKSIGRPISAGTLKKPKRRTTSAAAKRRNLKPRMCDFCGKKTPWFNGWRCTACANFYSRHKQTYRQLGEECSHGEPRFGCRGCRFKKLQIETARRQASEYLPDSGNPQDDDEANSDGDWAMNDVDDDGALL